MAPVKRTEQKRKEKMIIFSGYDGDSVVFLLNIFVLSDEIQCVWNYILHFTEMNKAKLIEKQRLCSLKKKQQK